MQSTILVLGIAAVAATTAVSAHAVPPPPPPPLPSITATTPAIEARTVPGAAPGGTHLCAQAGTMHLPWVTGFPPVPAAVENYLATAGPALTSAGPCADPVVTGSVGAQFSSWASQYSAWQDRHVSRYRELWIACSGVSQVVEALPTGSEGESGSACGSLVARITEYPPRA